MRFATETVISLIQPYAPHVAEELWSASGTAVSGRRPGPSPTPPSSFRHRRGRRSGQWTPPRPSARSGGDARGRARRARARVRARPGARQGRAAEDDRRARSPREPRRLASGPAPGPVRRRPLGPSHIWHEHGTLPALVGGDAGDVITLSRSQLALVLVPLVVLLTVAGSRIAGVGASRGPATVAPLTRVAPTKSAPASLLFVHVVGAVHHAGLFRIPRRLARRRRVRRAPVAHAPCRSGGGESGCTPRRRSAGRRPARDHPEAPPRSGPAGRERGSR